MLGLVQDLPLLLTNTLTHAATYFSDVEVVSCGFDGETRLTYRQLDIRARRLASALGELGIEMGGFAGSLAFTTHRHMELFHAVPGIGATLHTANPRHSLEQLAHAVNLTDYTVLFVDPETVPIAEALLPLTPGLKTFVILTSAAHMPVTTLPNAVCYEELIADGNTDFVWPCFDERMASTLCYTSGTTGDPKGCLYSHRGTLLNVMSVATNAAWGLSPQDTALGMSPFYHCNGWGLPFLAPMMGAKVVLPGRDMSGEALHALIVKEGVTVAAGVPTLWSTIIDHCRNTGLGLGRFERAFSGGAAAEIRLVETLLKEFGVRTVHAWGMTETTHGSVLSVPPPGVTLDDARRLVSVQGRPVFGSSMRIVDDDDALLPWDGKNTGRLQVRGPWMASGYFRRPDIALQSADGWMETGDVAVITPESTLRITDRAKDVIKSGGEWISSVALEKATAGLPGIAAVAAIAAPHPKWTERPLLIVVRESGASVSEGEILAHMAKALPKWWLPEKVEFVDALPYSGTGKLLKMALRERFALIYAGQE